MSELVVTQAPLYNASFISDYIGGPSPYFPQDSFCVPFIQDNATTDLTGNACPITGQMIDFLNLTKGPKAFDQYFLAYCTLGAPTDDGCPYNWCPNSDIAAPLIRIATYVITTLVTVIIYYEPEAVAESFWSQMLTVYSFLITSIVSISKSELTRIHAVIATGLVGSPLSIYIFVYALRSTWGGGQRIRAALGKGRLLARILVLISAVIWLALIIYILVPDTQSFAQRSCESAYDPLVFKGFFFLPLVIIKLLFSDADTRTFAGFLVFLIALPIGLTVVAWGVAIYRKRRDIWPAGEPWKLKWYTVWSTVVDNYPFVRFLSIVFLPTAYWIAIIELGAIVSGDEQFQTTFGQASSPN
ncbi:hypothetical protein M422DRAFT_44332 [Sphaerobolus stellatus SS14]|nr:hypothetical protein M422DRAFT_44332 [Sphaerobolus stellatus SS14]